MIVRTERRLECAIDGWPAHSHSPGHGGDGGALLQASLHCFAALVLGFEGWRAALSLGLVFGGLLACALTTFQFRAGGYAAVRSIQPAG